MTNADGWPPDDPMRDVTFTVPLRIDSGDRLSNLLAIVGHLRRTYPSRIIIGSEEPDSLRAIVPRGVEVMAIEGGLVLPFHHTRVLNDLARMVDTTVLVNIETDIIIPEAQLREAVRLTSTGEADLVLPYDFAVDVRREERKEFAAGVVTAAAADGRTKWHWDVIGGCMVWNAATFTRVGMENEHFISWGLEDDERLVRVQKLGGVFRRLSGPLFHLQHERGPDSSDNTPYFPNNREELRRITALSPAQLTDEVRTWPWLTGTTSVRVERVPADDLTVTIPVRLDSMDRFRNVVAAVRALRNTTTARVIVGIDDPERIIDSMPEGVEVIAVDDPPGPFHRTRILNELARHATTEFLANHDTDVIATVDQWRETLALLRDGADLVLPFAGVLREYPYSHHVWLERAAYSSLPPFSAGVLNPYSVGGCVVWRRSSFLAAGMENERFLSWGFEDVERIQRARTLGLTVRRAAGELAHLHHFRGPDSTHDNDYFMANHEELARIQAMSPEQLAAEIATWPWGPEAQVTDRGGNPLILIWSNPWFDVDGARRASHGHCRITIDRADFQVADAVVFPIPTMGMPPQSRAFEDQLWVLWSQESEIQFPDLTTPEFADAFDIRTTYQLDSDVPIPYADAVMFDRRPQALPLAERCPVPVSAWISSSWDRCGRDDYLRELMQHIAVDSYGKVAHNADLDDDKGRASKLAAVARYRFTVAFENSIARGYVTEKLYQPLLVGSVPIYRGAPDVARHLPATHCCVNADDFAGPRELAEFLTSMTDDEYLAYHAWRDEGPSNEFRARFETYRTHALVRLARMVRAIGEGRRAARRTQPH